MTVPAPPATPAAEPAPPRRGLLRTAAPWVLSILLVIAAWFLTQIKQPEDAVYESFVTSTTVGEHAQARNLSVTVTEVRGGRAVVDERGWRAEGTWLVVDIDAAAVQTPVNTRLVARLRIGDRLFSATERGTTARDMGLFTGVPRHGSLAFELPEGAIAGPATLILSRTTDDAPDGVIEVALDLDDVTIRNEVTLDEIGWAK
ncbi:hypothetical protein [Microbacterium sp. NPDC057650]|uniref:hypothetical protein n=1 Tax=unclassified Microbacterium TaxID=2609290 RepID=UPI00366C3E0A